MKNSIGILIGIMLNLYMDLGSVDILAIFFWFINMVSVSSSCYFIYGMYQ